MTDTTKYFLLVLQRTSGDVRVEEFNSEPEALVAHKAEEVAYQGNPDIDVLLVGSDSLETVRITHASYFGSEDLLAAS